MLIDLHSATFLPVHLLHGSFYNDLFAVFAFQVEEVVESLAVEIIASGHSFGLFSFSQGEQCAVRDPFGEPFDDLFGLCARRVSGLPCVSQFVCGHPLEQRPGQVVFDVDISLLVETVKEAQQVLRFGIDSGGGGRSQRRSRTLMQLSHTAAPNQRECGQYVHIKARLSHEQRTYLAVEWFRLFEGLDRRAQTGPAAPYFALRAGENPPLLIERSGANTAARPCIDAGPAVAFGRAIDGDVAAQDGDMTAITHWRCLSAVGANHYTSHRHKLARGEIAATAARNRLLAPVANLQRIIVDFIAAQNRLVAEIAHLRFLPAVRTDHRATYRRKLARGEIAQAAMRHAATALFA